MSNLKISQLPEYSGDTSGSWLVMNNSGETVTYKVEKETFLGGYATNDSVTSLSSSIAITDLNQNNRINSLEGITGSFAITGSNRFVGNQIITGSLIVSSSVANDVTVEGRVMVFSNAGAGNSTQLVVSGAYTNAGSTTITPGTVSASSGSFAGIVSKTSVSHNDGTGAPTTSRLIGMSSNPSLIGGSLSGITVPSIYTMSGSNVPEAVISFQHRGAYTDGRVTIRKPLEAASGSFIRTNLTVDDNAGSPQINLIGQNSPIFRVLVPNASLGTYSTISIDDNTNPNNNMGYQLSTYSAKSGSNPVASFYGGGPGNNHTGGGEFMYAYGGILDIVKDTILTGSFNVSGSTIVTGSVQGNVVPLTITSNTASLNLDAGNYFTLQLVSGSATHINPTNIKPGETVSVLVNTIGSATVTFPSSVKQITGSNYIPTTSTGVDILTLISMDTSSLYLVNAKNFV